MFWKVKTSFLHNCLFVCFWRKKLSFYLIFSHFVIETENFRCACFYFHIFSNSLLTCFFFKSLNTVLLFLMKSYCCIYSHISNYSFFLFFFWRLLRVKTDGIFKDWFVVVSVLIVRIGSIQYLTKTGNIR